MNFAIVRKAVVLSSFLLFCTFGISYSIPTKNETKGKSPPSSKDALSTESVVLITVAAGFLGSELALALHRTYQPKHILLVDPMVGNLPQSQETLSLFEFQRQRAFNVMQTLGPKGTFYRVDLRPMIPEYYDLGEVPVLQHIFQQHPDITHVVHLADEDLPPYTDGPKNKKTFPPVIPRQKDVPKAGLMEALLEQLVLLQRQGKQVPHFIYASTSDVYPIVEDPKSSSMLPFVETQTLSTPSSIRGATKLINEILAKLYNDMHGIYSIGLRFFSIYGPWGVPGSPIFEMAERAVSGDNPLLDGDDDDNRNKVHLRDYVYIDDAVDEIMAAMQFRPYSKTDGKIPPVVINVASGRGTSLQQIANMMLEYFPRQSLGRNPRNATQGGIQKKRSPLSSSVEPLEPVLSYGSMERAQKFLGYQPRVSLEEGIVQLLAWHYDRAFPYGGRATTADSNAKGKNQHFIASQGIVSCLPTDKECLRGAPVFPCASECSHEGLCIRSHFDDLMEWTESLTANCETVLYTVDLNPTTDSIPSAHLKVQTTSKSFVDGACNLAFVAEHSPLVQSLKRSRVASLLGSDRLLRHGEWILIPVNLSSASPDDLNILKLLPKLSPGLFFSSETKRAIYTDPTIILDSVPKLLEEASMQPYMAQIDGATALLIGKGKRKDTFLVEDELISRPMARKQVLTSTASTVQNSAYRMVRIAVADELVVEPMEWLDSRWMVHTLQSEDSRLFRCDVYGEVIQWQVDTDSSALEFILGLHDMWSRIMAEQSGYHAWWMGEHVVTVPEGFKATNRYVNKGRRLQETEVDEGNQKGDSGEEQGNREDDGNKKSNLNGNAENQRKDLTEGSGDEEESVAEEEEADEKASNGEEEEDDDETKQKEEASDEGSKAGVGFGRNDADAAGIEQQEVNTVRDSKRGASSDYGEDDEYADGEGAGDESMQRKSGIQRKRQRKDGDPSSWMGVLSSTAVKYFVRIVPSSQVGVVSLEEYVSQ